MVMLIILLNLIVLQCYFQNFSFRDSFKSDKLKKKNNYLFFYQVFSILMKLQCKVSFFNFLIQVIAKTTFYFMVNF